MGHLGARWTPKVARWTPKVTRWTPKVARWTPKVARWTPKVTRWTPKVARCPRNMGTQGVAKSVYICKLILAALERKSPNNRSG